MSRPVFGTDIDDTVVIGNVSQFFDWLEERGIFHCRQTYYQTHSWKKAVPDHDPDYWFEQWWLSGQSPMPLPMPGAQEAICAIHCTHDVHFITRRNAITVQQVQEYLVSTIAHQRIWPCGKTSKQFALAEAKARFFVDDSINELGRLLEVEIEGLVLIQFPSFLEEKPNQHLHSRQVIRLKACDKVGQVDPNELRAEAWAQIVDIVLNVT